MKLSYYRCVAPSLASTQSAHCSQNDSHLDIKALRLPNGRLLWSVDSIKTLIAEGQQ